MTPLTKPSRTARLLEKRSRQRERKTYEAKNKAAVRRRDKRCRFPLCGCKAIRVPLEVSHDIHKGMGGDPAMVRSSTTRLVLFCRHRHQDGAISRHKGTLRVIQLTKKGYDGPVAFYVDVSAAEMALRPFFPPGIRFAQSCWVEVAHEAAPGVLEARTPFQDDILRRLAAMDI